MKKLYVAARTASTNDAQHLWDLLAHRYEPALDWTSVQIIDPESDVRNRKYAIDFLEAAKTADAFVLIDKNNLSGAFGAIVEFGVAVANGVPCVIVKPLTRQSIFMALPNVRIVDSVEQAEQAIDDINRSKEEIDT